MSKGNVWIVDDSWGFSGWCFRHTSKIVIGLFVLLISLALISCAPGSLLPNGASVVQVDGCQYVVFITNNGAGIVHKANCPNHRDKEKIK